MWVCPSGRTCTHIMVAAGGTALAGPAPATGPLGVVEVLEVDGVAEPEVGVDDVVEVRSPTKRIAAVAPARIPPRLPTATPAAASTGAPSPRPRPASGPAAGCGGAGAGRVSPIFGRRRRGPRPTPVRPASALASARDVVGGQAAVGCRRRRRRRRHRRPPRYRRRPSAPGPAVVRGLPVAAARGPAATPSGSPPALRPGGPSELRRSQAHRAGPPLGAVSGRRLGDRPRAPGVGGVIGWEVVASGLVSSVIGQSFARRAHRCRVHLHDRLPAAPAARRRARSIDGFAAPGPRHRARGSVRKIAEHTEQVGGADAPGACRTTPTSAARRTVPACGIDDQRDGAWWGGGLRRRSCPCASS